MNSLQDETFLVQEETYVEQGPLCPGDVRGLF